MRVQYSCLHGDVVVSDENVSVIASSDLATHIDDETGLHIAKCECINRVGQGRTKAEAVRSLEAVLTAYLRMQQLKGKLTAMLEKAPWLRQETPIAPPK